MSSPWAYLVLSFLIGFVILGQTITYPFFTIDDSDTLERTNRFLEAHGWKAYFMSFIPDIEIKRRYWPGQYVYNLFRVQLFGFNSYLWHLFHVSVYCIGGFLLALTTKRIYNSAIPGVLAFLVLLTAGEFTYQTTWFAYVFIMSIEPTLSFLWVAGAVAFMLAAQHKSEWGYRVTLASAFIVAAYSLTVKENAFPVVAGTSAMAFLLSYITYSARLSFRWVLGALFVCSIAWGGWVYSVLPKDEGYAGVGSLNVSAGGLFKSFKDYSVLIYNATGLLVPAGVVLGTARCILLRHNPTFFLLTLTAAICQLVSVLIWPDVNLRLIQPAMIGFVLLSTVELYLFATSTRSDGNKMLICIVLGLLVICNYIAGFLGAADLLAFLAATLAVALLAYIIKAPEPVRLIGRISGLYFTGFLALGLFVNGVSHVVSYPASYKATELTRHLSVRKAVEQVPPNGTVVWFADPVHGIFPYSCDIHARVVFNRDDITILPHTDFQGTSLKKGDMFVLYGSYGSGRILSNDLRYDPAVQGSYISPVLSYADFIEFVSSLCRGKVSGPFHEFGDYYEGVLPIYQVMSDVWEIPEELRK